jgi:AraC family transcriptional regulator
MDMSAFCAVEVAASVKFFKGFPDPMSTGSHEVMTVTHLTELPQIDREQTRDDVEILIPSKYASFHVSYRTPEGRLQGSWVREPFVTVIPARQRYTVHRSRHCDLIAIALDQSFLEKKVLEATGLPAPELVARYAAVDPLIRAIGNRLITEFQTATLPCAPCLESLAGVLAIHLAAYYGAQGAVIHAVAGLSPHKLSRVQAFINEHFGESIAVRQLAGLVHMSPYHFARMFKKATGQPPHAYITMRRLERARELLVDSELPLVEVAASVGFQTQAHFTEVFHKHTGVTPRAFRLDPQACRGVTARIA